MKPLFFIWSEYGSGLFLAQRLKRDGFDTLLYIRDPHAQDVGRGLVPKTTNPIPPRRSVVMFDSIGHGAVGQELRRNGHLVIGGNLIEKQLEADRPEAVKIMQQHGIRTPPSHEFMDVNTAIRFLEGHPGEWFVKAIGTDTAEAATYDAPDAETMIRYLRFVGEKLKHFQLSQPVQGTEVSINGWFDGARFVRPFDLTIEEKRFLSGDLGPRTGCESNLIWLAHDDALAELTLIPLEPFLREHHYVGMIDQNSIIGADGLPTGLEYTARPGFDATPAWAHLFGPTLGDQLEAFAAQGLDKWEPDSPRQFSATLRVTVPPYPLWEPKVAQKSKGLPLDPVVLSDDMVTLEDVMKGPDGPQLTGRDGLVGTVGATGRNVKTIQQDLLQKAHKLTIPNKQYRVDPISRASHDFKRLQEFGLAGVSAQGDHE